MRTDIAALTCLLLGGCATGGNAGDGSSGFGGSTGAPGCCPNGTGGAPAGTGSVPGSGGSISGTGGSASGGTIGSGGVSSTGGSATGGIGSGGSTGGTGGIAGTGGTTSGACGTVPSVADDPLQRGPWDVGVRTVTIGRLTVEVVYPAEPGTTAGLPEATYDIRDWLPPQEQSKVPDDASPAVGPIGGHLYRDVPIDSQADPFPVVIFIHGTASFRIASGSINTHWASRGFVVVAADYPGLFLTDQLNSACLYPTTGAQDIPGDVNAQIQALTSTTGELSFLAGRIDMTRLGISGHSQGGCLAAQLANLPNVRVSIPLSASTAASAGASLTSLMYISGINDTVMGYSTGAIGAVVCPANPLPATTVKDAYTNSPSMGVTKRLVGIAGGGHLVPTDLCQTNQYGRNAIQEAQQDMVCGINNAVIIGLPALFDCGTIDMVQGNYAVIYASTAALEEALYCRDRSAQFASMMANVPEITDFQHVP